ncbi:MAG: S1-like domain-containing RNA-binding protein [Campylobacterota bacterium]|nr:S1-like domain-containing RNA-binding protein [Campylobacterota bacterium]
MINKSIRIGEINTLKINRDTDYGFFLEAQDESEVLLPNAYITDDMKIDDTIDVFVYTDSEDRPVATTEEPLGYKDQFIYTRVVDTTKYGAFVDMGLLKDLFVPRNKQKTPFRVGDKRILRVVLDIETNRLIGVEKITSFLSKDIKVLEKNDPVDILIFAKTPLGYKVIVNNIYEGLIYQNEIFTDIAVGQKREAYIKEIRADGKIDISLQPIGKKKAEDINTTKIITLLKSNDGILPYNYKTDPETVKEVFGLSKKAYKRAITSLLESKSIELNENGMSLL